MYNFAIMAEKASESGRENEEPSEYIDTPLPAGHITEAHADPIVSQYITLFSTFFLSLFNEFEQHIYCSVSAASGIPPAARLSDNEMSNLRSLTPENRLRFILENFSADRQQDWISTVLRRDILTFLQLKSSLQSSTFSLPLLLQVCRQLETLLSRQSSLAQILGTEVTHRWREQLEQTSVWVNWLSRLHALPRDSVHSLLHGLFSNNLLPEWVNDLTVQAETVYRLLGQFDGLAAQLQPALKDWHQATTPLEKLSVFLELVTNNALMVQVMPCLQQYDPDIASILGSALLIKQTFLSNGPEGDASEHLATTLSTLLDPEFAATLRQRAGSHPPVPWLLDALTHTAETLQSATLSMGALRTTIRLSDPTLSWGQFMQLSMDDISVMQMAKTSLKLGVSLILSSNPWLDALLQGLLRLTDSQLWQACSRDNIQDLPLAIVRELHDDLRSEHSRLLPLVSGYLSDNTQRFLDRLSLLRQLLEAGTAGQSKSVMLALMVKSGRIGGAPDILTLITEKILHISLLWRLWAARNETEITQLTAEFDSVLAVLPDEYIKNIGAVMQWLPLLRDVYRLTGELPALNAGETPISWLLKLNQQLITINTPAARAIRERLDVLLPDGMMLSSALLRSVEKSLSTIASPGEEQPPPSQQSLRQWLWDSLRSLRLSEQTVRHILGTLKNMLLTPRMAVALMTGYAVWALPAAQAADPDGTGTLPDPDPAGIPDPQQLQAEYEWTPPEPLSRDDFILREQQAIELMSGREGENYWQHLTWGSGMISLVLLSAATGLRVRKRMRRGDTPITDEEAGIPLQDLSGPGRMMLNLSTSAPAEDSNSRLLPEHSEEKTEPPVAPGTLTRVKNWLSENPAESVLWTLGIGMLIPTTWSGFRWRQTQQRNVELLGEMDPTDLLISVTPELLRFLRSGETANVVSGDTLLPKETENRRVLPASPAVQPASRQRTKRATRAVTVTPQEMASPYLSAIVKVVWGDKPFIKHNGNLVYTPRYNLYWNADREEQYITINQGAWRVTETENSRIMLLHNEDRSTASGAGNDISTMPVHMAEGTTVWTTTFAVTTDLNALTHLFSWDAYSPEFIAILKKNLWRVLNKRNMIKVSEIMVEMDKSLEKLFLENYTRIQLSCQILQARMELELKIHDSKTWPSLNNEALLKQFYDKINPSQMDYYVRALSFEVSDRELFNEAFELSITGRNDHISEKEQSFSEDIKLQEEVIRHCDEETPKINKKRKKAILKIEKLHAKNSEFGLQVMADNFDLLQSLEKEEHECRDAIKRLNDKKKSAEAELKILKEDFQDYQEKSKQRKNQLKNYQTGIETAHRLISQKAPGLLGDNGVFNAQAVNTLRFGLIAKELSLYDMPRSQYSADDINTLQSLEAQKAWLLRIVNQQKITEQYHNALINIPEQKWYGSYRDILTAIKDATAITDSETNQQEKNYRNYLLAATVYRMRKEKHPMNVVKNYSA